MYFSYFQRHKLNISLNKNLNSLTVYRNIPNKIRNKPYSVEQKIIRFLQVTKKLFIKAKNREYLLGHSLLENYNSGNFG